MDTNLIERVSVLQCRLNQISSNLASGLESGTGLWGEMFGDT